MSVSNELERDDKMRIMEEIVGEKGKRKKKKKKKQVIKQNYTDYS